jgi:hypothetical protein
MRVRPRNPKVEVGGEGEKSDRNAIPNATFDVYHPCCRLIKYKTRVIRRAGEKQERPDPAPSDSTRRSWPVTVQPDQSLPAFAEKKEKR